MRRILSGWRAAWCVALMLMVWAPMRARAQALVDRVPKDAMVYVGWAGAANLGPAYEQSNLKGALEASNLSQQLSDLFTQIVDKASQQDPKAAAGAQLAHDLAQAAWTNPTALYFGGVDFSDPDNPMARLALIIQTGKSGETLAAALQKAFDGRPEPEKKVPATAKMVGDYLMIGLGKFDNVEAVLALGNDRAATTLAGDAEFTTALKQVKANEPLTIYANVEAGMQMIEDAALQRGGQGREMVPRILNALGLHAIKRLVVSSGFDQKDWATNAFIAIDAKRPVIAGFMDHTPLTDDALKAIPKTVVAARAIRFDGTRLLADLRNAANIVAPNAAQQIDLALQRGNMVLGFDIEKDFFGSLGDTWMVYSMPNAAGDSLPGLIVLNKLKDEAAATRAFESLQDFGNGLIAMRFGADRALSRTEANGLTMHTAQLPQMRIAPSWAIKSGYLAISLSPLGVQTALEAAVKDDGGLPANEAFAALRKRLDASTMSSFRFLDLPATAAEGFEAWGRLQAQAAAAAQVAGLTLPSLPPVEKIKPFLSPALEVRWSDEGGFHIRSVEPFPGSILLTPQMAETVQGVVAMFMPVAGRARDRAQVMAGSANLRQLGMAAQMYAADNGGALPPDLGTLLSKGYLGDKASPQIFVRAGTTVPADVLTQSKEDQATWINKNTSYEYTGAGKKTAEIANPGLTVLAYEKLNLPTSKDHVAILFLDGHVENVERARAEELVGEK